jgi:biopolymer transport protein ExbD
MTSRGFLIRFIDIGLIVLFGFVMISGIESLSQVELSQVAPVEQVPVEEVERTFVTVAIASDGTFTVADPASGGVMAAGFERADRGRDGRMRSARGRQEPADGLRSGGGRMIACATGRS